MNILMLYYLLIFVFVGIGGSLFAIEECDILSKGMLKKVFMYQYAVYEIAKDDINLAGIIILEAITTFSVWFLNIIIFIIICLYYILSAIWDMFYFIFKKR